MPAYQLTDRRHPVNRARLLHAAALEVDPAGTRLPTGTWQRYLTVAFAVTRQQGHSYTQLMEDLGMIRVFPHEAVELRPPAEVVLPPIGTAV